MLKKDLKKTKLPDAPGVYFFMKDGEALYIGKATSIRDRVKSYFTKDIQKTRGPLIERMLKEANSVMSEKTDSVLEALILESKLIKRNQPIYNSRDKSDKSFNYVVVTDEEYPRIFTIREREIPHLDVRGPSEGSEIKTKEIFGPFPSGSQLKIALKIIRKVFPFRDKKDRVINTKKNNQSKLNRELGLSPDFSKLSKKDYAKTIRNIIFIFKGNKKSLVKTLEREMKTYAKKDEFEKAERVKRQIFALEHINDIALITNNSNEANNTNSYSNVLKNIRIRIEGYDVAHTNETNRVGVMIVIENGIPKKSEYRKFKIKGKSGGDTGALKEILERRLMHNEWQLPKCIVLDGGVAQKNTAKKILDDSGFKIQVFAVTKDSKHKAKKIIGINKKNVVNGVNIEEKDILLANKEAHRFATAYHRKLRNGLIKRGIVY